jgi:large subunit ribosomal protein L24
MAAKLKTGDKVVVLAGKDKGKRGRDRRSIPRPARPWWTVSTSPSATPARARPARAAASPQAMPIDLSNLALVDRNGKPDPRRLRMEDGKKVRFAKTTGDVIDA